MCKAYRFDIPTKIVSWEETNTSCIDVSEARYPNASDCDLQLKFRISGSSISKPIKISGRTWKARTLLKSGAIEGRKDGRFVCLLIGKGRSQALYLKKNPYSELRRDIRILS